MARTGQGRDGHTRCPMSPSRSAAKLAAVQSNLKVGDKQDACGILTAFITQVNSLKASIGPALAAQLIAEAKQIKTVIGC